MAGQGPAYRLALGWLGLAGVGVGLLGCVGGQLGFQLADQRLELGLVEQAQLARGDAIGAGAEALAAQQLDVFEQLIDALDMLLKVLACSSSALACVHRSRSASAS